MLNKVLILYREKNNLVDAIIYLMEQEKIDYVLSNSVNEDVDFVINVDMDDINISKEIPILFVSDIKKILKVENVINYLITKLVNDVNEYTYVQKEYLFKKGSYSLVLKKIKEYMLNENNENGVIVDLSECKLIPDNWVFKFDSIADTYKWIAKMNKKSNKFIKEINCYSEKVYNDSAKEIDYLVDKLSLIKNGMKMVDIFLCTKEELIKFKNNYFFKALLSNINANYKMLFVNIDEVSKELVEKVLDGIIIYDDCVYRDTYDDEYSLGFVDCNKDSVIEYNKYFDELLDIASVIQKDGESNEI